jgi:hypothetical protein
VRLEGLGQLKKSNDLIGYRTRDLPACSIVPQPTTLPRAAFSCEFACKAVIWQRGSTHIAIHGHFFESGIACETGPRLVGRTAFLVADAVLPTDTHVLLSRVERELWASKWSSSRFRRIYMFSASLHKENIASGTPSACLHVHLASA